MKKGAFICGLILVLLLSLTTYSGAKSKVQTVKIGACLPLSGAAAISGFSVLRGGELLFDEINEAGGLVIGDTRYKFQIIAEDSKYAGDVGVQVANKLVYRDGVKIILGPISSAVQLSIQPSITEPNKVMSFMTSIAPPTLTKDTKYTFRMGGDFIQVVWAPLVYLVETYPQMKRVAGLQPDDPTGYGADKSLELFCEKYGLTNVGNEHYQRGEADFYPYITKLKALKPDFINSGAPMGESMAFVKQAHELGLRVPYVTWAPDLDAVIAKVGPEVAKMVISLQSLNYKQTDILSEKQIALSKKYWAKYGKDEQITCYVDIAYDAMNCLVAAMKKAGTVDDTTKLANTIPDIRWRLLNGREGFWSGEQSFGIKHQMNSGVWVSGVKDGKFTTFKSIWIDRP